MPTYDLPPSVLRRFNKLEANDQALFREALVLFVAGLKCGGQFDPRLRIKGVQGKPGWFEMTWAKDGRGIFKYGAEVVQGEAHVMWLAIGTHDELFGH